MGIYKSYVDAVKVSRPGLEPDFLLTGSMLVASVLILYVGLFFDLMLGALLSVIIFDVALGYPIMMKTRRVEEIEELLPDVLSSLSTSLRAGGTIESALKELSRSDFGPITIELKRMMREIREGKTFDEAFLAFGERTKSKNVLRSVKVIISAKRSGGGLVDALSSISEDMRENARLLTERRAKTMVQVLFIIIAACFVSPFIFGLVSGIILFLASVGGGEAPPLFGTLLFYFKGYLVLSAIFAAFAASMIREGGISKSVIYAPVLIIINYVIYTVVSFGANIFFGV